MRRYVGNVFAIRERTETIGASFHIRTRSGDEIWVTVKGKLPSIVEKGADIVVYGEWSAELGKEKVDRFAASKVHALEWEEDDIADKLGALYSFDNWRQELRLMHADSLDDFFYHAMEQEKIYIGTINFLVAVMDRYFELGYLSALLSKEGREICLQRAEAVANMIRNVFKDEEQKIKKFEEAYRFAKENYYKTFDSDVIRESGICDVD